MWVMPMVRRKAIVGMMLEGRERERRDGLVPTALPRQARHMPCQTSASDARHASATARDGKEERRQWDWAHWWGIGYRVQGAGHPRPGLASPAHINPEIGEERHSWLEVRVQREAEELRVAADRLRDGHAEGGEVRHRRFHVGGKGEAE